ncbi:MAG TPA: DUF547 domain-containing protein [Bryobacteraceae bacterium]|nr:DUF547 domain-containing protein [Bryobacteraceae bacterium]
MPQLTRRAGCVMAVLGGFSVAKAFFMTPVSAKSASIDYSLLGSVLSKYVHENGLVDYSGVKSDPALVKFIEQLASMSPDSDPMAFPTREAKLAYWINAYNATVLHAFAREYPAKRLRLKGLLGKASFFYNTKHNFGGVKRSLDDIETNTIRRFGEPRIHFAIVCASAGCPWLSREVYRPENLFAKLEQETQRYFQQSRNFRVDQSRKEIYLPEILKWFQGDWGTLAEVRKFVARYRPAEATVILNTSYKVRYIPYDWSPNDVPSGS